MTHTGFVVGPEGAGAGLEPRSAISPGAGEVRLRVLACGLNFADLLMVKGRYQDQPEPPFIPGLEFAGRIEEVGPAVTRLAPGDRVALYAGQGGLATTATVPEALCTPVPEDMAMTTAAAFQVTYGTAHLALSHRANLKPGERLVVTGAAGGAGLAAVEVGALMGAEVVAIARGAEKLAVAEAAGAVHLLDADAPDLRERVKALGGADVVYDTVGGALWQALFRAVRPEARLLPIGFAGGEVPQIPANHLLVKNISVLGFYWGGYLRFAPEVLRQSLAQVIAWIDDGRLAPVIGAQFPLSEAQKALDALASRQVAGKIVVTME